MSGVKKVAVCCGVGAGVVAVPVAASCLNITWELFLLLLMLIDEGIDPGGFLGI
jgi:hypothetical protein